MSDFTGNGTLVRNGIIYGGSHDTEAVHWSEASKSVKKNLLKNMATSMIIYGVTFTVNSDGTITANGTASDTLFLNINTNELPFSSDIYIDTYQNEATSDGYILSCGKVGTKPYAMGYTVSNHTTWISMASGATLTNEVIKPMLRLASIADATYEPYIPDNVELNELKADKTQITNPNLLDNPWFTVNQRGQTQYTGAGGYSLDRWGRTSARTVLTVNTDDITLASSESATSNSYFIQYIEDVIAKSLIGKTVTISIMYSDGTIEVASGVFENHYGASSNVIIVSSNVYQNTRIWLYFDAPTQHYTFSINTDYPNKSTNIKAVKLEVGSISTLALDTAPNYATELLKCQRYFVRIGVGTNSYGLIGTLGYVTSATQARIPIVFPTTMRTLPSITASGNLRLGYSTVTASTSLTGYSVSTFGGNAGVIIVTSSGLDTEKSILLMANNDTSAHIDLIADL